MVFSVVLQRIFQSYDDFLNYSQQTLPRRTFFGILVGFILWFSSFILSLLLDLIIGNNTWGSTFLHDMPGFGLILALIVTLDFWGLLPRPVVKNMEDEKSP